MVLGASSSLNAQEKVLNSEQVGFSFAGSELVLDGMYNIPVSDGPTSVVTEDDQLALRLDEKSSASSTRYAYLAIDDSLIFGGPFNGEFVITYKADQAGSFRIHYDSLETGKRHQATEYVNIEEEDVGKWLTTTRAFTGAQFVNSQNGGADCRIAASGGVTVCVQALTLRITSE